jgi:hypothetical protein
MNTLLSNKPRIVYLMNCKILFPILLTVATSCGSTNKSPDSISQADSDKRVRNAIDSVLRSRKFDEKSTGGILPDTLRAFMRAYRDSPLPVVDMQQQPVKGFFISDTLIDRIKRDPRPINGLYVYFAKKTYPYPGANPPTTSAAFNGKYTIIVIPSIPSPTPGQDELLYLESLEWHDPVTQSAHTPINENELYYPNQ